MEPSAGATWSMSENAPPSPMNGPARKYAGVPRRNGENGMTTVTDSFDADARITPAASSAFAPTAIDAATAAKANLWNPLFKAIPS